MSMFRNSDRKVPGLNTASLPDLIFTVLFFFMIVTHMRETELKVSYRVPQGTQIEKLVRKSVVSYIYIGKPSVPVAGVPRDSFVIQLNDKYADVSEIAGYISAERSRMAPEDLDKMTVSIKADRDVPMGMINDVKQALRSSSAVIINYSADSPPKKH